MEERSLTLVDRQDDGGSRQLLPMEDDDGHGGFSGGMDASFQDLDVSFANEGNYQEAADYLNQELSYDKLALSGAHRANSLGAPLADTPHTSRHINNPVLANFAPVNFDFPSKADKVHCINVLHALFLEVQKSKAGQEETRENIRSLQHEISTLEEKLRKKQEKLEDTERDKWDVEMRKRTIESEARKVQTRLKTQNATLEKQNVRLRSRDNQYKHEMRKRELEFKKLQERLHGMMSSQHRLARGAKNLSKKGGAGNGNSHIDIKNRLAVKGEDGGRRSADGELLQQTVRRYSEQMQEIVNENVSLREHSKHMRTQFQELLRSHGLLDERKFDKEHPDTLMSPATKSVLHSLKPEHYDAPFSMMREPLEEGFSSELRVLRKKLQAMSSVAANEERAEEIAKLRKQLHAQKEVIAEQERQIQEALERANASDSINNDARRESLLEEYGDRIELLEKREENVRRERQRVEELGSKNESRMLQVKREREELDAQIQMWHDKFSSTAAATDLKTPARFRDPQPLTYPTPFISTAKKAPFDFLNDSVLGDTKENTPPARAAVQTQFAQPQNPPRNEAPHMQREFPHETMDFSPGGDSQLAASGAPSSSSAQNTSAIVAKERTFTHLGRSKMPGVKPQNLDFYRPSIGLSGAVGSALSGRGRTSPPLNSSYSPHTDHGRSPREDTESSSVQGAASRSRRHESPQNMTSSSLGASHGHNLSITGSAAKRHDPRDAPYAAAATADLREKASDAFTDINDDDDLDMNAIRGLSAVRSHSSLLSSDLDIDDADLLSDDDGTGAAESSSGHQREDSKLSTERSLP